MRPPVEELGLAGKGQAELWTLLKAETTFEAVVAAARECVALASNTMASAASSRTLGSRDEEGRGETVVTFP